MQIVNKDPKTLLPSTYNPREITEQDFEKLKNSIKEFGFVENVVINPKNEIIGGHMRVRAAIDLNFKEVPCLIINLPVRKEKLLNLALNRISGRWDNTKLGELITELGNGEDIKLSGFDEWELDYYNQGPNEEKNLWNGMPEFDGNAQSEAFKTIIVHFDNLKDVNDFSDLIGQKITENTKYLWYPEKEKENNKSLEITT